MDLIPEGELRRSASINLAPMVDFLFLVVAVFAVMTVSRSALYDAELELVKVNPVTMENGLSQDQTPLISIVVTEEGSYKWVTDVVEFLCDDPQTIKLELIKRKRELENPLSIPIKVLLHIDKHAKWEAIAQIIFAIKETGLPIFPIYENSDEQS